MTALFRVASITFDEGENVAEVHAVAAGASLDFIQAAAPGAKITDSSPAEVTLAVSDVLRLHRAAGEVTGNDPRQEGSLPVWESLSWVIYGLIEE